MFAGGLEYLADAAQRFTFGVVDSGGRDVSATVQVFARSDQEPRLELGTSDWRRFAEVDDLGAPKGFHVVTLPPLKAGLWDIEIEGAAGLSGRATIEIVAQAAAPSVGTVPPSLQTPTDDRPLGYEQVCTRKPNCGLHETSLDAAMGRETILLVVGSPLLCQSRTCGPVIDEVLSIASQTSAKLIHVEPYTELNTISLGPIMESWKLPSEPWVFLLDRNGRVTARFEGPVVAAELLSAG